MMLIGEDPIGFAQVLSAPPWQFTIQLPSDISPGRYALRVNGDTGVGDDITSSPISIDVERSDAPAGISVSLPAMDLRVGDTGYPRVSATYSDGSTLDVTESGQVSYQSDTPGVATVINDGRVTAVGPGSANISINYGDISIQVPVTVKPPLTIVPAVSSIYVGQTERLYAQFTVPGGTDTSVVWSLNPALGSIDGTGQYTAPDSLASWQGVTAAATSVADPTLTASAQIWVFPPVSMSMTPSSATLSAGQSQPFTAPVGSGSADINWSVSPPGVGTILPDQIPGSDLMPVAVGTYVAPDPITSPQTVTVTATSVYDNSKSVSGQVTLVPSVAVSIGPGSATLFGAQSRQFTAAVNYNPNGTVSWSATPNIGTISAAGLYTAPAVITGAQTVTVTATSQDSSTGMTYTATATITLMPWQVSDSITVPGSVSATAASNSEIDLTWTASSESGGQIAGYNIFRNGAWAAATTVTSYADLGLLASTSYSYTVAVRCLGQHLRPVRQRRRDHLFRGYAKPRGCLSLRRGFGHTRS